MNSRFQSNKSDERGFTLLEVLIAIAIMVGIAFGIYQMTTNTFRIRQEIASEGDFYNSIRFSMDILQRDIALIYSPVGTLLPPNPAPSPGAPVTNLPPPASAKDMEAILSSDLGQTTQFWLPAKDKSGVRPSHFIGTDNKISFVASSHLRIYKDSPESYFAKVAYELKHDEGNTDVPDALVLVKTENTNAFVNEEKKDSPFYHVYPLLHGIKKFRFRYYSKERDQWFNSWDNEKDDFREKFPDIVEIDMTVNGPERLSYDGKYRFRPEVPLRGLDPST